MDTKSATVRARIEPKLKEETELIFEQLGISTTEAIRVFFKQVTLRKGLPFDVSLPNAETIEALKDGINNRNTSVSKSPKELFDALDV